MTGLQNSRNPALADFDWRTFAQKIRLKAHEDGRAQAVIAAEIGITETDLSRVRGGQMVSVAKAIALARWLGPSLNAWYLPPIPMPEGAQAKTTGCTGSNVKQSLPHASGCATAPAGRRTGADARSGLRPAAGAEGAA